MPSKGAPLMALAACAVIVASYGVGYSRCRQDANAAVWQAEDRVLAMRDSLQWARRTVRVDSVLVDSVVTRWRTGRPRVDTLLARVTDTVWRDTFTVVLQAADSTIAACDAALSRCQAALALAERAAGVDSARFARMRVLLAIETARASRAERQRWRYRFEGALITGAAAYGVSQLTRQ